MRKKLPETYLSNNPPDLFSNSKQAGCKVPPYLAMETTFYIVLNIRTVAGFESFAKFFIGNKRDFAYGLFKELKGSPDDSDDYVLQLDLMETKENLPLNLQMIGCTLDQLAENCKIIAKETFKFFALQQTGPFI